MICSCEIDQWNLNEVFIREIIWTEDDEISRNDMLVRERSATGRKKICIYDAKEDNKMLGGLFLIAFQGSFL